MKNSEINKLSIEELKQNLAADTARLQKMRFAHAITPLESSAQLGQLRRHIARLQTELRKRQIEATTK